MHLPTKAALAAIIFSHGVATADVIRMDNGDRYAGVVSGMAGGTVELRGEYGNMRLPWSGVAEWRADQPLVLILASGVRVTGAPILRDGHIRFTEAALPGLTVPAAEVVGIRPLVAPDLRLEGRINAGATSTAGNTDTDSYHLDGELVVRGVRNRLRLRSDLNYGSNAGKRSANDAALALSYDHFVDRRWYINSNLGLAHDEFENLRLRTTAGIGAGYQLRDLETDRLALELGVSYIQEDFEDTDDRKQPALRYALTFLRKLAWGPALFHRQEVLVGLESADDILLHTETGLRLALLANVTGTIQINLDYDWLPAPDAEPEDVAYLLTLGYEF